MKSKEISWYKKEVKELTPEDFGKHIFLEDFCQHWFNRVLDYSDTYRDCGQEDIKKIVESIDESSVKAVNILRPKPNYDEHISGVVLSDSKNQDTDLNSLEMQVKTDGDVYTLYILRLKIGSFKNQFELMDVIAAAWIVGLSFDYKELLRLHKLHSQLCFKDYYKTIKEYREKIDFLSRYGFKSYIMKDENTGLYKIGRSKNPKRRERTLQSEKPTIKMVKVFDNDIEKKLHAIYNDQRVRGEWFELTPIQVKYICTHY